MEEKPASDRRAGIRREELQGKLQDPSGVDIWGANDQQMPAGGEGLEGGSAGKFTRPYREGGEPARSGGRESSAPAPGKREEKSRDPDV